MPARLPLYLKLLLAQEAAHAGLTEAPEAVILSRRETLHLPLEHRRYITRTDINAVVSRSGLARCLERNGMARLEDVIGADA